MRWAAQNSRQLLWDSEFIDLSPEQVLDLGFRELRREQQVLAKRPKDRSNAQPIEV